jgi:hypothetical protein
MCCCYRERLFLNKTTRKVLSTARSAFVASRAETEPFCYAHSLFHSVTPPPPPQFIDFLDVQEVTFAMEMRLGGTPISNPNSILFLIHSTNDSKLNGTEQENFLKDDF